MKPFRVMGVTLFLGGLALAVPAARAQPGGDTVARLDTVAQHLSRIGRASGEAIWPGFRPDTIPVAFVLPTQGTALFHWRGVLPEGYAPLSGVPNGAWRDERALGAASTGTTVGGRRVAQVVVASLDPAILLPTAVHEAFHVFEAASVKPAHRFGRQENAFYVSSYPVFDAENEWMFAREGELLGQALRASSLERLSKRDLARQFVAVRRARHRRLDDTFAQFDKASEMNEGLAKYAQVRALDLMTRDQGLPADWRVLAQKQLSEEDARLANLTGNVTQSFRLRFYSTGPAQARLLDAIASTGWKRSIMERNETLQDALARAVGMDVVEERALARATLAADTSRVGSLARTAVARLRALRAAQVDSVLSRPGKASIAATPNGDVTPTAAAKPAPAATATAAAGPAPGATATPAATAGGNNSPTTTSTEVKSPTSTSTEVRSPTSTSTQANTAGNVTVTGGAGAGATTTVTITNAQPEKKGQGNLLAEWVNTLGQTVQRTVDSTGKIVERTLDTTGKALSDKPAGSLLDLPVISQTTNAEGQPTKQVRDTTGAIIEYTVVKGQIINTRVVTPAPAKPT